MLFTVQAAGPAPPGPAIPPMPDGGGGPGPVGRRPDGRGQASARTAVRAAVTLASMSWIG
ncbi:hypothetical protein OV450_1974 [Actinobacteria bacterium OV450]|nr:hypothetical protein OV450_1974 [Actinobacteria bacterium OV450]